MKYGIEKSAMIYIMEIKFGSEYLQLLPQRAIYWPKQNALVLSDVHLGKAAYFRSQGSYLPIEAIYNDLNSLDFLINHFNLDHIIIVGDLFHASRNTEWDDFINWKKKYDQLNFHLVAGNHDTIPAALYKINNIEYHKGLWAMGGLNFSHMPMQSTDYLIFGHVHPAVIIKQGIIDKLTLDCFYIHQKQLMLPAFGYLTGRKIIKPTKKSAVHCIAGNKLFKLPDEAI
ncbi:MAG: ligase-associated damage response endonuclease PdeM [Bacteroidota bacterium]|jgi:DNA ligase-associated metallophosphoesterase